MGIAQLARKFGQAILPVRISVSGLAVSQRELEDSFTPRIPLPRSIEGSSQQDMLDLEFVERTDVGRVRDHNEDYLGHASPGTPAKARTHGWLFEGKIPWYAYLTFGQNFWMAKCSAVSSGQIDAT